MAMVCALFVVTMVAGAQDDGFREAYEDFRRSAKGEYEDFRRRANAEYAEWVRKAWQEYKALPSIDKPKEKDRPPVVMDDKEKSKPIKNTPLPIKEKIIPPAPEPQPKPVAPIREKVQPKEKWRTFRVYGTEMKVRFGEGQQFRLTSCDGDAVAEAWQRLSEEDYNNTIRDCLSIRMALHLSDWAYLNVLCRMSEVVLGKTNEAVLLAAFVYCQSGYQMRLGMVDDKLRLLYASKHHIYGKTYFEIDGMEYYVFEGDEDMMEVCDVAFPQEKALSLYITEAQEFAEDKSDVRTLEAARYPDMNFKVSVNRNLVEFYNSYPSSFVDGNFMTRWAIYANTPMNKGVKEMLYPALRERIKGLSKKEAVEKILNWVQTAFVYEYDTKVWGEDRAFFAEETLFYPYCDCEDRSILFSRIMRDLLGLKVILVYYPGHLASAVCMDTEVKGDYIELDGERFTICDATYIGAPMGRTMPGMNNEKATVILLQFVPQP